MPKCLETFKVCKNFHFQYFCDYSIWFFKPISMKCEFLIILVNIYLVTIASSFCTKLLFIESLWIELCMLMKINEQCENVSHYKNYLKWILILPIICMIKIFQFIL